MDKKMKEIEEISTGIVEEYTKLLKPFLQEIVKLNAHIKELEERLELAESTREDALAYAKMYKERIKELEEELKHSRISDRDLEKLLLND